MTSDYLIKIKISIYLPSIYCLNTILKVSSFVSILSAKFPYISFYNCNAISILSPSVEVSALSLPKLSKSPIKINIIMVIQFLNILFNYILQCQIRISYNTYIFIFIIQYAMINSFQYCYHFCNKSCTFVIQLNFRIENFPIKIL